MKNTRFQRKHPLIVIIAFIAVIIVASLSAKYATEITTPQIKESIEIPDTFVVLSKQTIENRFSGPFFYVVKDTETNTEYILVQYSGRISLIPRNKP